MMLPGDFAKPTRTAYKVRKVPPDEAAQIRVELQLFMSEPTNIADPRLLYLMDALGPWHANGYCGNFDYFKYRRALTTERSKRLNAG